MWSSLEAKYTMELRVLEEDPRYEVFGFDYDFYEPQLKPLFEKKFTDHFYYNEIGFETIPRFRHALKTKLNDIMPYYSQLYRTELAILDIDFMLNKDLVSSTVREFEGDSANNQSSSSAGNSKTDVSNLDNGVGSVSLAQGYLTGVSGDSSSAEANIDGSSSERQKETITITEQGNIGVVSPAALLEQWRKTIINIDQLIFAECQDLFMLIY